MKKIFGIVCAAIMALIVAGCASTNKAVGDSLKTESAQQNLKNGLPAWADAGVFTSEELKSKSNDDKIWKGYVNEDGMFFPGSSNFGDRQTATTAAEMDAKGRIAENIRLTISRYVDTAMRNNNGEKAQGLTQGTLNTVVTKISGIRRVDRYVADDGYVYVLMFLSNKNIQAAKDDTSMSDYERRLLDAVFPVGATVTE